MIPRLCHTGGVRHQLVQEAVTVTGTAGATGGRGSRLDLAVGPGVLGPYGWMLRGLRRHRWLGQFFSDHGPCWKVSS